MIARPGFPADLPRRCSAALEDDDPNWSAPWPVGHYTAAAWAAATAIIALIGTGVSVYSQISASQQQAAALQYNAAAARYQADYQARIAEYQAQMIQRQALGVMTLAEAQAMIGEQQALAAEAAGRVREAAIRNAYNRTQSDVRATIGKAGVDTTGSPLLVLIQNADTVGQELSLNEYQSAVEAANARAGAAYALTEGQLRSQSLGAEAGYARFGGLAAANASLTQANLLNYQAGGIRTAGRLTAGSTLLSGTSNAVMPYLRYGGVTG